MQMPPRRVGEHSLLPCSGQHRGMPPGSLHLSMAMRRSGSVGRKMRTMAATAVSNFDYFVVKSTSSFVEPAAHVGLGLGCFFQA